jgi:hypothetical protein
MVEDQREYFKEMPSKSASASNKHQAQSGRRRRSRLVNLAGSCWKGMVLMRVFALKNYLNAGSMTSDGLRGRYEAWAWESTALYAQTKLRLLRKLEVWSVGTLCAQKLDVK